MKFVTLKYYLLLLLTFFGVTKGFAQETSKPFKVNMEMATDEKGDVVVTINVKYNAATWEELKQNHGTDASIIKNVWKREFPKYELTDFNISNVDIDRTTISKFKILGMLKVDENGKWQADLDQKDPDITKVSDNQFLLVDGSSGQTLKIFLPSSSSDAKVEKDSFGKAILTYTAPASGGGIGNIIKYLGFLVAAGGIFLFFKNNGLNTVFVKDKTPKKIDYRQTKNIDDAVVINTRTKEPVKSNSNLDTDNEQTLK